jgi:hypothetical protein
MHGQRYDKTMPKKNHIIAYCTSFFDVFTLLDCTSDNIFESSAQN